MFVESVFVIANRSKISLNLPKYLEKPYCPSKFKAVNCAKMFMNKIALRRFRQFTAYLHIIKNFKETILSTIEHEINISWPC